MATGRIAIIETATVNFTFPNNVSAEITFAKVGSVVVANITGSIPSNATQPGDTIYASQTIPIGFRPNVNNSGNTVGNVTVLCSRTDAGINDAANGNGLKSFSTFRFYNNGQLGLGMLSNIITGVDVQGVACYIAQ